MPVTDFKRTTALNLDMCRVKDDQCGQQATLHERGVGCWAESTNCCASWTCNSLRVVATAWAPGFRNALPPDLAANVDDWYGKNQKTKPGDTDDMETESEVLAKKRKAMP